MYEHGFGARPRAGTIAPLAHQMEIAPGTAGRMASRSPRLPLLARARSIGDAVGASAAGLAIDEWIARRAKHHQQSGLPGRGTSRHRSHRRSPDRSRQAGADGYGIGSIPSSDIEIGGAEGKRALEVLKSVFERVGKPWRPAAGDEGFEHRSVRRLFEPIEAGAVPDRDERPWTSSCGLTAGIKTISQPSATRRITARG